MDADADIVFGASEVVRVAAGATAIAWALTRVSALVRIPVVAGVVISHDVINSVAVVINIITISFKGFNIIVSRADQLLIFFHIFLLSAGLVQGEHLI